MHFQCSVQGCTTRVTARFSPLCPAHRQAFRRHGHPEQSCIRPRELAPFVKLIAKRQADNADSPAWAILRSRWAAHVDASLAVVDTMQAGKAYVKAEAEVARLVHSLAGAADADKVLRAVMAVVMHSRADPRRYRDDRAVQFQAARAAMRLAPGCMGRYYDQKARTSRTVRRDVPPRVLSLLGSKLMEAFGGAAAQLHHIEVNRVPPAEVERRKLAAALEALKV